MPVPRKIPKLITRAQEKKNPCQAGGRITSDGPKDRLVDKERRLLALPVACCRWDENRQMLSGRWLGPSFPKPRDQGLSPLAMRRVEPPVPRCGSRGAWNDIPCPRQTLPMHTLFPQTENNTTSNAENVSYSKVMESKFFIAQVSFIRASPISVNL